MEKQQDLFKVDTTPRFDGETYKPKRDHVRLSGQHKRVFDLMKDGKSRTLAQIEKATSDPQASISARLRDLRKDKFGGHKVKREYIKKGLHEYKLILNVL